jgi:hypothetical protein
MYCCVHKNQKSSLITNTVRSEASVSQFWLHLVRTACDYTKITAKISTLNLHIQWVKVATDIYTDKNIFLYFVDVMLISYEVFRSCTVLHSLQHCTTLTDVRRRALTLKDPGRKRPSSIWRYHLSVCLISEKNRETYVSKIHVTY